MNEEYPFSERDSSSDPRHSAGGSCRAVHCCLLVSVFVSTWTSCFGVQVGAQLSPKAQGIPMAPLGWLLKHSRRCDMLRLKPLEHLEHHLRPPKKYQSAFPVHCTGWLGRGEYQKSQRFFQCKRKSLELAGKDRAPGVPIVSNNCSLHNWQARFSAEFPVSPQQEQTLGLAFLHQLTSISRWHTPVYFHLCISPKVPKNSSISLSEKFNFWAFHFFSLHLPLLSLHVASPSPPACTTYAAVPLSKASPETPTAALCSAPGW